jgi:GNAT superfamily N-acetyltransferase
MAEISLRRDPRPGDMTAEGDGTGRVRWFVLRPAARGAGLGAGMLGELVAEARAHGHRRLELEMFSDLAAAAHRYTSAGFARVAAARETRWGRTLTIERYELRLGR